MKEIELTSKKTGKVQTVSEEVYNKLVSTKQIGKYRVRELKSLITRPPQIIKPAAPEEKKVTKTINK